MQVYNDELRHHGVLGMKWGKRLREIRKAVINNRKLLKESDSLSKQSEEKYKDSQTLYNKSGNNYYERVMNNDKYARKQSLDPKIKRVIDESIKALNESNDLDRLSYLKKREAEKEYIKTGKSEITRIISNKIFI